QAWTEVANSYDRVPPTESRKLARLREKVLTDDDRTKRGEFTAEVGRLDAEVGAGPPLAGGGGGEAKAAGGAVRGVVGGDPQKAGDAVVPASLSVLSQLASAYRLEPLPDEGARRVALANWITAADNPLTSRVLANRVWQWHFGQGIVDTPSDFGYMGSR